MLIRFKKSSVVFGSAAQFMLLLTKVHQRVLLRTTENCIIAVTATVKNVSNILGNENFS
jgi:hypothetical protein